MKLIGYVAHNLILNTSASKTIRLKNVTNEKLRKLTADNLASLKRIIEWNIEHSILFYRITSNLIPYATHPVNKIHWPKEFEQNFHEIGALISECNMAVSMHPGQYTVLSSPDKAVVERAIDEIEYHNTILNLLNAPNEAKIIIHLGGGYGNKNEAMKRFIKNYKNLSHQAIKRLVIENDDVLYTVDDCLKVYQEIGTAVVFDNLHYQINPGNDSLLNSIKKCLATWDNLAEVHYSDQAPQKVKGAHAYEINIDNFFEFYRLTKDLNFKIMLETKDKEQSVLRIKEKLKIYNVSSP